MPEVKRLFNAMNLHIEENKTITKVKDGIKSTIKYNHKPIMAEISNFDRFSLIINRSQSIVFTQILT